MHLHPSPSSTHVCHWCISEVCPESIQPCTMKNRGMYWRRHKIRETLYRGWWCLSPFQSRQLGTSHSSPNHHQLPHHNFLNLHQQSETSSISKVIFVWGTDRSCRTTILGYRGSESPGRFDVSPKYSAWAVIHERVRCHDEAANHQLPITVAFWIIWIVSTEECSRLTQNLMQIHCSTRSFWMQWPHSTRAHSPASTTPTD